MPSVSRRPHLSFIQNTSARLRAVSFSTAYYPHVGVTAIPQAAGNAAQPVRFNHGFTSSVSPAWVVSFCFSRIMPQYEYFCSHARSNAFSARLFRPLHLNVLRMRPLREQPLTLQLPGTLSNLACADFGTATVTMLNIRFVLFAPIQLHALRLGRDKWATRVHNTSP